MNEHKIEITPVAIIETPFKEKFGIPRQAGLANMAKGKIIVQPPYDDPLMFEGLDEFSHLWLCFIFHDVIKQGWKKRVRPPRLGGNKKKGVFATRSPFRPNHLGMSVVRLLDINYVNGVTITVEGVDLLDQTPIVDIKPYLSYADSITGTKNGFAKEAPKEKFNVLFSDMAKSNLEKLTIDDEIKLLIESVLSLDPRPAFHDDNFNREYHVRLNENEISWVVKGGQVLVTKIKRFVS